MTSVLPAPARAAHRYALAEAFRLELVARFSTPSTTLLDLGCGPGASLGRCLMEYPKRAPHRYLGVDTRKVVPPDATWADVKADEKSLVAWLAKMAEAGSFNLIHVPESQRVSRKQLPGLTRALARVLADGGTALVGTTKTGNRDIELDAALTEAGLVVADVIGVAAREDARELREALDGEGRRYLRTLAKYYPLDVAGAFLAATEPDAASHVYVVAKKVLDLEEPPVRHSPNPAGTARKATKRSAPKKAAPKKAAPKKAAPKRATPPPPASTGGVKVKVGKATFVARNAGDLTNQLLRAGGRSVDEILEARRAAFPHLNPKKSDVVYCLRKLRDAGEVFPDPVGYAPRGGK